MPLALLALASLPALAAIYWLRNRYRRHTVSSLMLWQDTLQSKEGGTRINRLQTPLLFLIELAVLAILAFAATGPRFLSATTHLPLKVVLDDSYSMRATVGGAAAAAGDVSAKLTARDRAIKAIDAELRGGTYAVQFVLAGREPRVLGEPVRDVAEAMRQLDGWRCGSSESDLERAIAVASELGGARSRVLVITDRKPDTEPKAGLVEWRAFGVPTANVAFVGATRSRQPDRQRCLFEIANLSATATKAELVIEKVADGAAESSGAGVIERKTVELDANATRNVFIDLKPDAPAVRARLTGDALPVDNDVLLLRPIDRPVRVHVNIADQALAAQVNRALDAVDNVTRSETSAELLLTDGSSIRATDPRLWAVRFTVEPDAVPYLGPFVIDYNHPLTDGLALRGAIWGAGKTQDLPGRPLVTAGNVTLISDVEQAEGRHDLRIRFTPGSSTVQDTPNWPVLMWNLVQWRASHTPGPRDANVKLGDDAAIALDPRTESVTVTRPDGAVEKMPAGAERLLIPADQPGVWRVVTNKGDYAYAVNTMHRNESDLRDLASGDWGSWAESDKFRWEYRNIAWVLALIAVTLLVTHMALISRSTGKGVTNL
ncbi:MAG: hypothetical protein GC159_10805 [Phycisphaera sp.]|nr:hypothetical protein [Phycisphaera sp.]